MADIASAGIMACWAVFLVGFILLRKYAPPLTSKRDARARYGLLLQVCGFSLVWVVRRNMLPGWLTPPGILTDLGTILAIPIAIISVILLLTAVRALGRQWSLDSKLREDHQLITAGPYRIVRNPIYTGMFGMMLATGLVFCHWLALLMAVPLYIAGTMIRVSSEEKLLREHFGETFREYENAVPALFPYLGLRDL